MGINPIEYRPWKGEKRGYYARIMVIAETLFREKLKSKGVLALLIIGIFLVHAFSMIFAVLMPHESLTPEMMASYMQSPFAVIFILLLASIVCSDAISEDFGSNSFVLYFSRAIKVESYLAGKIAGCMAVIGIFSFLPPILYAIIVMATQSGDSYDEGLRVFGSTIVAGLLTSFLFVPYAMVISSLTRRKTYASVGIFMSFFVLMIISGIFSMFEDNWMLLDPTNLLFFAYSALYGFDLPTVIDDALFGVALSCFLAAPLTIVYLRVHLKAVGK